jgi:hypothetical protein
MAEQGARTSLPHSRAVIALGLLMLACGLIAALAVMQVRGSRERAASSQTAAIAASLSEAGEGLAGVAPTLLAKGFDQPARDQLSPQVHAQQQNVQRLIDDLSAHLGPGEAIVTIRAASAELFETIDRLSPAISSRAVAEAKLRRALAAVASVLDEAATLSGQPRGAPIARWLDEARDATSDIFAALAATDGAGLDGPSTAAGVMIAHAQEIAEAAGGETAAGSRAAAPALPGLHARFAEAVTGSDGVFAAQREMLDLDGQLRQWLGRNEAAATRMNGALGALAEASADTSGTPGPSRAWWLTLAGAIAAIGVAIYAQFGVVRGLRTPKSAPLPERAAASAVAEHPQPPAEAIEIVTEAPPAVEAAPAAETAEAEIVEAEIAARPDAAETIATEPAGTVDHAKPAAGP